MKCKKIQELLLADYLDGETDEVTTNEVNGHMAVCTACRQFEQTVHDAARKPFACARRIKPPETVWNRVQEAIASGESSRRKGFPARLQDMLRHIFAVPKAAFSVLIVAVAALVMMVILSDFHLNRKTVAREKFVRVLPVGQVKYLSYVMEEPERPSVEENDGYGTAIEEYFL